MFISLKNARHGHPQRNHWF